MIAGSAAAKRAIINKGQDLKTSHLQWKADKEERAAHRKADKEEMAARFKEMEIQREADKEEM